MMTFKDYWSIYHLKILYIITCYLLTIIILTKYRLYQIYHRKILSINPLEIKALKYIIFRLKACVKFWDI